MVTQILDNITFSMQETYDFSFLRPYGKVFAVFDQNDSGNISFGMDDGKYKHFIKVAGTKTAASCRSQAEAIEMLKSAIPLYRHLAHPRLIQLKEHFACGNAYAAVFRWADGDCLFDHWNFDYYNAHPEITPPRERFRQLSVAKRLSAFDTIFDFLLHTEAEGYAAVDFYDGSIMYDFTQDIVTICDIDFFRKKPLINHMGEDFWGTKRLKAPEEYILGAEIDSVTNVFTLGALLMHFFGDYNGEETRRMYSTNAFIPCRHETWELSEPLYAIALKAVSQDRANRFGSIKDFNNHWKANQH